MLRRAQPGRVAAVARRVRRDTQRDGAHRAQVGGHVFADFSITAGHPLDKEPILIMQHDGQAVDLGLDHEIGG